MAAAAEAEVEGADGAAGKGKKNVVYITVSTGIGGGAVIDGRLMRGSNGNAAELGHIPLTMDGPRCGCGNPGCWEVYASGTAIARRTREALAAGRPSGIVKFAGSIDQVTTHHLFQAMAEGDALANEIGEEALVARLLAITQNKPDTRVFVRADKTITYGRVMEVMGTISAGGALSVSASKSG